MAINAALGASKILIILGASVAGSILVQNGSLSDFVNDTYAILVKHLKNDTQSGKQSSLDPSILAQLNKLKLELRHLASERGSITVVSGSSRSNGAFLSVGVPALLLGATGYGYMRWRGLSLSDFMYVTKRGMSDAISSVSQNLEQVTTALSAARRHLNSRIDKLSGNLDQNMELQGELRNEVGNLRGDVSRYCLEIESVQRIVQSLGVKIDSIESKQDIANHGVIYLCNFVESMQTPPRHPQSIQGNIPRPRLERTASAFGSGLKELQSISYALQPPEADTDIVIQGADEDVLSRAAPSSSLQRNLSPTFSFGSTRRAK